MYLVHAQALVHVTLSFATLLPCSEDEIVHFSDRQKVLIGMNNQDYFNSSQIILYANDTLGDVCLCVNCLSSVTNTTKRGLWLQHQMKGAS